MQRAHIASTSFSVVYPSTALFSKHRLNLYCRRKSCLACAPGGITLPMLFSPLPPESTGLYRFSRRKKSSRRPARFGLAFEMTKEQNFLPDDATASTSPGVLSSSSGRQPAPTTYKGSGGGAGRRSSSQASASC